MADSVFKTYTMEPKVADGGYISVDIRFEVTGGRLATAYGRTIEEALLRARAIQRLFETDP